MMALKVFVDFDGTITKEDVGNAFFRKYAGPGYDDILREYTSERISAHECYRRGAAAIGSVDRDEARRFVRAHAIDESFRDFVRFCTERTIDLCIVSDGLDFYIHEILAANDIPHVPVFCNVLRDSPAGGHWSIDFPYADAECTRCACCKRNILLTRSGEDDIIVYVGEGYSDRCPVQYADVVFAKDVLQTFCQQHNISYYLYASFHDVLQRMEDLLSRKRLRKRLAALMKRREVFVSEP